MSATALFGNTSGLGGSSGGNKHLVEFRAGRMTLKGRMVHPDKRKGLLYVYQGEDSLMHFCWKDRTTGEVEDDLLIFPDDCEFVRVNECTTGRVYVLKFKSFSKKYFFWMQEPKTDKDDDYCRRINEALNNPPTSGGRGGGSSGGQDGELQNILNNMSQQQLMQLLGGVGQIGGLSSLLGTMGNNSGSNSGNTSARPSAGSGNSSRGGSAPRTTESSTTRTPSRARDVPAPTATPPNTATAAQPRDGAGGQIYLSDLQRYFSGLGNAPPEGDAGAGGAATAGGAAGAAGAGGAAGVAGARVDLAAALSSPEVVTTATAPGNASRLTPHLPPASPGAPQDDVRTTLLSPQFAQAANQFSSALTSGQMGPVISQFGLPSEVTAAANTGDMQSFFKSLENTSNTSDKPKEEDKKKDEKPKDDKGDKKDDDAEMSLD
ncbi:proteasomal ubiquitin receptor ADRM1 isoform X1 [Spodoptera frugiperda]|uniref:Proteasomal ubiquitin receptor ADRM1 homolog n=1 Tax=Spodoptera frugiperda TaxID=7108 RepID=A0A9R0DI13_SPOFR|nr:proteasomal ubiquitin receptor ADRM1 isoform X1 [Spodoptera frugiperda]